VSGGLTDELCAGLSVQYAGQGLGWGKNIYDDTDTHKIDHAVTVRGRMIYDLDDSTTVKLGADYGNREDSLAANFRPFPGYNILFPVPQTSAPWDIDSYIHNYKTYAGGGGSAIIEHDLAFAKLTSSSAFRDTSTFIHFNPAATSVASEDISYPESSRQATEELQLVSKSGGRLDWATGVFYFYSQSNLDAFNANLHGRLAASFDQLVITTNESIDSVAGYAQGAYKITPSTRVTVGGRYTYQKNILHGSEYGVRADGTGQVPLVPQPSPAAVSSAKPMWRLALDHDFSASMLGYASYNRGSKSGGFNTRDPSNPAFLPEQLDAYEVGLKSELFGHRVRLNTAAFDYEYQNIQVSKFTTTQVIENGAQARIYGLDEDLTVNVTAALRIAAGVEWLHARFLDFPAAQFTLALPGNQGAKLTSGDASGRVIPNSPTVTGTFGVEYEVHTSAGNYTFNVTDNYDSGYYGEPDNRLFQQAFHLLNASIAWLATDERWGVRLYANNLLDKAVASQISSLNVGYVAVYSNPPRIYGAAVHFSL
jgi:outer membrane receptor protein involved in Fe transport